MSLRRLVVVGLVLALDWARADAGGGRERSPARSVIDATAARPLRVLRSVSFSDETYVAWVNPARCDEDGNVFLLGVRPLRPRGSASASTAPPDNPPRRVLRISADGTTTTSFDPARLALFEDADEVTTGSIALDPSGTLLLLAWVPRSGPYDGSRQYIVSFDKAGRGRARQELDPRRMAAGAFEVFGSGELLLLGRRPEPDAERVAVLSPAGRLRDVIGLTRDANANRAAPPEPTLDHMVRAADGRIYFVRSDEATVYVVEPVGYAEPAFDLAPTPGTWRLTGLNADGPRLAATYFEETPATKAATGGGRHFVAVYDLTLGERVAVYGPVPGLPVCYAYTGSEDRFTVLRDANRLATLAP